MRALPAVALSFALLGQGQQGPTLTPDDPRAVFLAKLPPVLRGDKAPSTVTGFTADVHVRVTPEASDADAAGTRVAGDVTAEIAYLRPLFVRTRVKESERVLTRGHDEQGAWQGDGQRAWRLGGKDYERDRKAVLRERSIAALMTRCIYPDRELARLAELKGPTDDRLTWGRLLPIDCLRLSGVARDGSDYPLALTPGHKDPVRVSVWFRRDNLHPVAIRLEPLDAGLKPQGPIEELRLFDHRRYGELLLPERIEFFGPNAKSKLTLLQQIKLSTFSPNPSSLVPDAFKMPAV